MSERAKDAITIFIIIGIVMTGLFVGNLIKKQEQLNKDRAKVELVVESLNDSNTELKKSIELKKQSNEITDEIIKDNLENKQKQEEKVDYIQTTTKTKIKEVHKKAQEVLQVTQDKTKIEQVIEQRDKETSRLRITSLWIAYCLEEPGDQQCTQGV